MADITIARNDLIENYTEARIPKKQGYRQLHIPSEELKQIQRKVLYYLQKIWPYWCFGIYGLYCGSYINHANLHSDSRYIFQFDIKDAFPSTNISYLRKVLYKTLQKINQGLSKHEQINFCECIEHTQTTLKYFYKNQENRRKEIENIKIEMEREIKGPKELAKLIIKLTTYKRILPQGAPTSPFLFYLMISEGGLFKGLQYELLNSNHKQRFIISCYIDNFVISSDKPISSDVQEKLLKTVEKFGFKVNKKKTRYQDCRHGAVMIAGLRVDGTGRVYLSKKTIRKWRGIIHRAYFAKDQKSKQKIDGFIASLKPIYKKNLPLQIVKPLEKLNSPN